MTIRSQRPELARRTRAPKSGLLVIAILFAQVATAAEESEGIATPTLAQRFALHGQFAYVEQRTDAFEAPYAGANSLSPKQSRETTDFTLFIGARLWSGAELWINPEIDQGFGLDNTLGVAGFPSFRSGRLM